MALPKINIQFSKSKYLLLRRKNCSDSIRVLILRGKNKYFPLENTIG